MTVGIKGAVLLREMLKKRMGQDTTFSKEKRKDLLQGFGKVALISKQLAAFPFFHVALYCKVDCLRMLYKRSLVVLPFLSCQRLVACRSIRQPWQHCKTFLGRLPQGMMRSICRRLESYRPRRKPLGRRSSTGGCPAKWNLI